MRKILYIAVVCIVLLSCSEDKMPNGMAFGVPSSSTTVETPSITASEISLSFAADGESKTITITSNFAWESISIPDWATISPTSGKSGSTTLTITADKNTNTTNRTGTITLGKPSHATVSISISQSAVAKDDISASVTSLDFTADGGSKSISVTSNFSWQTLDKPSWITVTPSSGSSGTTNITISASKSTSTSSRSGTISLGKTSANVSISVSQAADSEITSDVTSLSFSADGGVEIVSITTKHFWGVNKIPCWITLSQTKGSKGGTYNIDIRVSKSTSNSAREGIIAFGCGSDNDDLSITVGQAAAKSSSTGSDRSFKVTGNGKTVNFKMKYVQAGSFTMGQCYTVNHYIHSVTLTNDYYIGETEVTQALWYAVMGKSPTDANPKWEDQYGEGDNYPAYFLNYNDCLDFISKLNALTGEKFRLPTEAEWEYAANGGNKSQSYTYSGGNIIGDVAWYRENSDSWKPVATKKANELGIYDMSGNADEWCFDWYGDYDTSEQTNPTGPTSGTERVIRGGDWLTPDGLCGIQDRGGTNPDRRDPGLRLALTK